MSVPNHHPKFLVELNKDCLFHIFSHLQLPELLNIRLTCSTLDVAVREHLPHLETMSVAYSEHVIIDSYDSLTDEEKRTILNLYDRIDDALEDLPQNHFGPSDIITIHGRKQLEKLLKFIEKYKIKNITKLALIIDSGELKLFYENSTIQTIPAACELLELCPKVETLILDRTRSDDFLAFETEHLRRLFSSINGLAKLKALYFFTRRKSEVVLRCYNGDERSDDESDSDDEADDNEESHLMIGNFFLTMLDKLRLFSMNRRYSIRYHSNAPEYLIPLFRQSFDNIQYLSTQAEDIYWLNKSGTTFKNLRSLTVLGDSDFIRFGSFNSFQQLRTLNFDNQIFRFTKTFMLDLNYLPNLEKLFVDSFFVAHEFDPDERVEDQYINRTIKHLFSRRDHIRDDDDWFFTELFQGLLTFTICQPVEIVYQRHEFYCT